MLIHLKCPQCHAPLQLEEGSTVLECEYCGSRMIYSPDGTLPAKLQMVTQPEEDSGKPKRKAYTTQDAFALLQEGNFEKAGLICKGILYKNPENAKAHMGKLLARLQLTGEQQLAGLGKPLAEYPEYIAALACADEQYRVILEECDILYWKTVSDKVKGARGPGATQTKTNGDWGCLGIIIAFLAVLALIMASRK